MNYLEPTAGIRFLLLGSGILLIGLGAWMASGRMNPGNPAGLRFARALADTEVWRRLHIRSGRILVVISVIFFIPFTSIKAILFGLVPLLLVSAILWFIDAYSFTNRIYRERHGTPEVKRLPDGGFIPPSHPKIDRPEGNGRS